LYPQAVERLIRKAAKQ